MPMVSWVLEGRLACDKLAERCSDSKREVPKSLILTVQLSVSSRLPLLMSRWMRGGSRECKNARPCAVSSKKPSRRLQLHANNHKVFEKERQRRGRKNKDRQTWAQSRDGRAVQLWASPETWAPWPGTAHAARRRQRQTDVVVVKEEEEKGEEAEECKRLEEEEKGNKKRTNMAAKKRANIKTQKERQRRSVPSTAFF